MKIIVGLGNIGEKYSMTRHNAGFLALDKFVSELTKSGLEINWKNESKLKAITAKVPYNNQILLLAKPTTFMNLSGQAVSKMLNFFKEPVENLIVIYDDVDLPIGKVRTRQKGSAGTHNGIKSIIQELGSEEFKRIKIGIESRGEISPKQQDLSSFVLSDFLPEEREIIDQAFEEAISEIKNLT